jgi:hypothetical protein
MKNLIISVVLSIICLNSPAQDIPKSNLHNLFHNDDFQLPDINIVDLQHPYNKEIFKIDSTMVYEFLSETDSVQRSKESYYYNDTTIEIVRSYKEDHSDWRLISKQRIIQYQDGKLKSYTLYDWKDDIWVPFSRDTYTYSEFTEERIRYNYNETGNFLEPRLKYYNEYDEYNRIKLYEGYSWDSFSDTWLKSNKYESTFDEEGAWNIIIRYSGDENSNTWILSIKDSINYNNSDITDSYKFLWNSELSEWYRVTMSNVIYYTDSVKTTNYSWKNEEWNRSGQSITKYLPEDTITTDYFNYSEDSIWFKSYKSKNAYLSNGMESYREAYNRTHINTGWVGNRKFEKEFDNQDKIIMELEYTWYGTDWQYSRKVNYSYNKEGLKAYELHHQRVNDMWEKDYNKVLYYSGISSIDNDKYQERLFFYPNPAKSHITLSNHNAIIQLHNLQGQLILKSTPGEDHVSLKGFAPGVYIAIMFESEKVIGRDKLIVR